MVHISSTEVELETADVFQLLEHNTNLLRNFVKACYPDRS